MCNGLIHVGWAGVVICPKILLPLSDDCCTTGPKEKLQAQQCSRGGRTHQDQSKASNTTHRYHSSTTQRLINAHGPKPLGKP